MFRTRYQSVVPKTPCILLLLSLYHITSIGDFTARDGRRVINCAGVSWKGARGESVFPRGEKSSLFAMEFHLVGRATLNFHALHSSRPMVRRVSPIFPTAPQTALHLTPLKRTLRQRSHRRSLLRCAAFPYTSLFR